MRNSIFKISKKNKLTQFASVWRRNYSIKTRFPEIFIQQTHQQFNEYFKQKYGIVNSNPSLEDTARMADIAKKFYEQNKDQDEVKDFKNSLKKFFSDKQCIAIEIENLVQPSSHELKQDVAYKVLVSASVFENYGVMRIADKSGKPILQENVSNNYIDFHCDSIDPNTFPYFTAIVSIKSNSKAITRVIEAKEICAKLQKDHPRSMAILTELEFVVQKVTPPSFIELSNPIKIIQLNTDNTFYQLFVIE